MPSLIVWLSNRSCWIDEGPVTTLKDYPNAMVGALPKPEDDKDVPKSIAGAVVKGNKPPALVPKSVPELVVVVLAIVPPKLAIPVEAPKVVDAPNPLLPVELAP